MKLNYEKLEAFYLGKEFNLASKTLKEDLILYDSKDLNTHAVIIGMTGSGKTGLGIGLLEEALMDEFFGYFPPVGNPPSKTPLLTLLKQARLFCRQGSTHFIQPYPALVMALYMSLPWLAVWIPTTIMPGTR